MCHIQIKDADSISGGWQACHVIMYSVTAALSLASCVVFYTALSKSRLGTGPNYYCYLYNVVLMKHEQSRHVYRLHFLRENVWYQNGYCHDVFTYPLHMFVFATTWMAMCLVFGHGGTIRAEQSESKFFRYIPIRSRSVSETILRFRFFGTFTGVVFFADLL